MTDNEKHAAEMVEMFVGSSPRATFEHSLRIIVGMLSVADDMMRASIPECLRDSLPASPRAILTDLTRLADALVLNPDLDRQIMALMWPS